MKRLLLFVAFFSLLACPAWAQQNCLIPVCPDTFAGVNTNNLSTYNASQYSAASNCCGEVVIAGTPGYGGAHGMENIIGQTWTGDQFVEAKVDATNVASIIFAVCVRVTGTGSTATIGYCAGKDSSDFANRIDIWKLVANSPTSLTNNAYVLAVGDVLNFQSVGTTLTLLINGGSSLNLAVTDVTYATGNPGLLVQHANGTDRLGGSVKAGRVGGGAPAQKCLMALLGIGSC